MYFYDQLVVLVYKGQYFAYFSVDLSYFLQS